MATQKTDFQGDLWFFTADGSPKVQEIEKNHEVNVSYSDPKSQKYVSVSGIAQKVRDRKKIEELWSPAYNAWFPEGLNDPNLCLLKVSIQQAEYWDSPSSSMIHLFGMAKTLTTGKPARPEDLGGEHGKIKSA